MRRIDEHTVELDDMERLASDFFDDLLDSGMGMIDAGIQTETSFPTVSREFIDYLVF